MVWGIGLVGGPDLGARVRREQIWRCSREACYVHQHCLDTLAAVAAVGDARQGDSASGERVEVRSKAMLFAARRDVVGRCRASGQGGVCLGMRVVGRHDARG